MLLLESTKPVHLLTRSQVVLSTKRSSLVMGVESSCRDFLTPNNSKAMPDRQSATCFKFLQKNKMVFYKLLLIQIVEYETFLKFFTVIFTPGRFLWSAIANQISWYPSKYEVEMGYKTFHWDWRQEKKTFNLYVFVFVFQKICKNELN